MFRRRTKRADRPDNDAAADGASGSDAVVEAREPDSEQVGEEHGPWDSTEVPDPPEGGDGMLDLGSVRVPIPDGAQIQVEVEPTGTVSSVHLVTEDGRITVAAFAAPRSAGLWREVAAELAQGLRADEAQVSIEDGPWGREVLGVNQAGAIRFLGADGPRWMVRCVAAGPDAAATALGETARQVLRETVVVRGDEPLPVRTALAVTIPPVLAEQLALLRQQAAEQAVEQAGQVGGGYSAMQELTNRPGSEPSR